MLLRISNPFLFLTLLLAAPCLLIANKYEGLKVKGDYQRLNVKVREISSNGLGVTSEMIKEAAETFLNVNNFKSESHELDDNYPNFIEIKVTVSRFEKCDNFVFTINLCLVKSANFYNVDKEITGKTFIPDQGEYFANGNVNQRKLLLQVLEVVLEDFLIDYTWSNND